MARQRTRTHPVRLAAPLLPEDLEGVIRQGAIAFENKAGNTVTCQLYTFRYGFDTTWETEAYSLNVLLRRYAIGGGGFSFTEIDTGDVPESAVRTRRRERNERRAVESLRTPKGG